MLTSNAELAASALQRADRLRASVSSDPDLDEAWSGEAENVIFQEELESAAVEMMPGHIEMASLRVRLG
jgi:hypothetical protein